MNHKRKERPWYEGLDKGCGRKETKKEERSLMVLCLL